MDNRPIGQTKAVGFQVGVRRNFPVTQEEAWKLVTSPEGLNVFRGEQRHYS